MWLVKYGLNQAEVVVTVLLEAAAAEDEARQEAGGAVQMPDAAPLLDDPSGFDSCLRCSGSRSRADASTASRRAGPTARFRGIFAGTRSGT